MKKLLVSIFALSSIFAQCSLNEKILGQEAKIKNLKANVKTGNLNLRSKCSGFNGGCSPK